MKALLASMIMFFSLAIIPNTARSQWSLQESGTTQYLYSVHFINNFTGYAAGDSGTILKSTDGGIVWSQLDPGLTIRLASVRFINSRTGWAVGDSGTIVQTRNGGTAWLRQQSGTIKDLKSVFFVNQRTGWITGDSVILKTTNRGVNWVQQQAPFFTLFYSVFFINSNTGWITGYSTLKTTNGGAEWVLKSGPTNKRCIFFMNPDTGWAVGGVYTITRTTDGGETWGGGYDSFIPHENEETDSPPATFTSIQFMNANTGCYTSSHAFGGRIILTTNGGTDWTIDYPTTRDRRLTSVCLRDLNHAWAVGQGGTILRRSVLTQVNGSEVVIPSVYRLYQNYPNPFNPLTTINFDIPRNSKVNISIFDASGRRIAEIFNGETTAGVHSIKWDGSAFASGVYFCRLTAGDFSIASKMILVK